MGRVINTESSGKDRNKLCKTIVLSIRELMRQSEPDDKSRDLAAYMAQSLIYISKTVDDSVGAWEKKGYWIKADRFRLEWEWTKEYGEKIDAALHSEDWGTIALWAAKTAQKLAKTVVSDRNRLGTPWEGAYKQLMGNKR